MDDINTTTVASTIENLSINVNETLLNLTLQNSTSAPMEESNRINVLGIVLYGLGILGNALAMITLRRGERRVRNRKYLLLLTSLAANDLVALVGMMSSMIVCAAVPSAKSSQVMCAMRVVLRVFGTGSVCIAVTMAFERYLALTRPFIYQKQVTYYAIRTALLGSWFFAAVLTCAPIFGIGLYYDPNKKVCLRYREAETIHDFSYAVIYVVFGTILCGVLVYCNFAVICALYAIRAPKASGQTVVRRVSKKSCMQRQKSVTSGESVTTNNTATAEEVAFSRLMATLSCLFIICWMPQMVTSTFYLSLKQETKSKLGDDFKRASSLSDFLMLCNYVLNPLLYVLMRSSRRFSFTSICHSIAHCFKREHKTSTGSMKTSCCPQDMSTMASDASGAGAELRPLRGVNSSPSLAADVMYNF